MADHGLTVKETGPPLLGTQISTTSTQSSKFQNDPGLCDKIVNSVIGLKYCKSMTSKLLKYLGTYYMHRVFLTKGQGK